MRNIAALLIGGVITGVLGACTLFCVAMGKFIPLCRTIARAMPEFWGQLLLWLGHEKILGRAVNYSHESPPEFDGVTVIICNHPTVADTPALMGVLARWGLRPSVVSKVENLRGIMGLFLGWPLALMGRGVFINRANSKGAKAALASSGHQTILIFPDMHRPSATAIEKDREKFPSSGLTTLCVPRGGGLETLIKGALGQKKATRVLDVTILSAPGKFQVHWNDVTTLFVEGGEIIPTERMKNTLLDLWREKEREILAFRQEPCHK